MDLDLSYILSRRLHGDRFLMAYSWLRLKKRTNIKQSNLFSLFSYLILVIEYMVVDIKDRKRITFGTRGSSLVFSFYKRQSRP